MSAIRGDTLETGTIGTELAASGWAGYLETVTLVCHGMRATVEALDGPRPARRAPGSGGRRLRGLRLDERRGVLEVALGGSASGGPALRCFLERPRAIFACERAAFHSIVVLEGSGLATLIEIHAEES